MNKADTVASYKGVLKFYKSMPQGVREYFTHFEKLIESFPQDVLISHMFALVELAQNQTLYCGIVKLHRADAQLTRKAINAQHLTRESFRKFYSNIFGKEIPKDVIDLLKEAESIRDQVVHGKQVLEKDKRKAIVDILDYSKEFNGVVSQTGGFEPFGSLQGFKGAGQSLDSSTTRWILKGMGFSV